MPRTTLPWGASALACAALACSSPDAEQGSSDPCDPERIYAAVIEKERDRLAWVDLFLSGEITVYRGPWSADGVVADVGSEPFRGTNASTSARAMLEQRTMPAWWDEWSDAEGAWLRVREGANALLRIAQPAASPASTYLGFYASEPDYRGHFADCAGCFPDLASRPDVIAADAVVLRTQSAAGTSEVTVNLDLARVPPAELTGEDILELGWDGPAWTLEAGRWVSADCNHYTALLPDRAAAWYRVEYSIDDADPFDHGVAEITVLACE